MCHSDRCAGGGRGLTFELWESGDGGFGVGSLLSWGCTCFVVLMVLLRLLVGTVNSEGHLGAPATD